MYNSWVYTWRICCCNACRLPPQLQFCPGCPEKTSMKQESSTDFVFLGILVDQKQMFLVFLILNFQWIFCCLLLSGPMLLKGPGRYTRERLNEDWSKSMQQRSSSKNTRAYTSHNATHLFVKSLLACILICQHISNFIQHSLSVFLDLNFLIPSCDNPDEIIRVIFMKIIYYLKRLETF